MIQRKLILIISFSFFLLPFISSLVDLDFEVQVNSPSNVNIYQGKSIDNLFSATITNNGDSCNIACDYTTTFHTYNDEGIEVSKGGGQITFPFEIKTEGVNGVAPYTLTITCDRITSLTCWSNPESFYYQNSFTFLWNGDGICTTANEKCIDYNEFLYDSSCGCPLDKECRPDSAREIDSKGCVTYCGNGIKESIYETCSNCPSDIGRCDGWQGCVLGDECEGGYCVNDVCWNKPWKERDNFCDNNEGENCKNSVDCVCKSNELCSNSGVCEKQETSSEEITDAVKIGVQETLEVSKARQKNITYGAIGLIFLVFVIYFFYKFIKENKKIIKKKLIKIGKKK